MANLTRGPGLRDGGPTLPPQGGDGLGFATEENYLRAIDGSARSRPTRAMLTFTVGGETYGVGIEVIREIIKLREITEVPRAPAFLLGVITVRGAVIPVIDLRVRLGLEPLPPTRAARILVAISGGDLFGLMVDSVSGVMRFTDAEIETPPSALAGDDNFIAAIARQAGQNPSTRKGRLVVLLHLDALVTFEVRRRVGYVPVKRPSEVRR